MAKYLTEFDTYAQYSGATLSLPNVSLIKATGEVYYKNVFAGDTLGDVLMYDIANDKLVSSIGGNWSAESFPIASYTPIAVNVYPASQTPDGKNRYLAVRWASNTSSTGSASKVGMYWGPDSTVLGDKTSSDGDAFNGRENQDKAEAVMPGTNGNSQAEWTQFYACSIFAPPGTQAGDWYLPSYQEIKMLSSNFSTIDGIMTAIKTAAGTSYLNEVWSHMNASTEGKNVTSVVRMIDNGAIGIDQARNNKYPGVRAMISL